MANNEVAKSDKKIIVPDMGGIFSSAEMLNGAITLARTFAQSPLVPKEFQNNIGSCLIALDMAARCKTSPLMVMQNLYVVYGKPSWSSKFIIAIINQSRKYATPLQFEFNKDRTSCYAWATDYEGNKISGPTITIEMAKREGWYGKNGSKWPTMPELMLRYRAATQFGNTNCSELLMGLPSTDEVMDVIDDAVVDYEIAQEKIKTEANVAGEIGINEPEPEPETVPEQIAPPADDGLSDFAENPSF